MTGIEVPPHGLPPLPKLFEDIAQVRPAVLPDPLWRGDLLPSRMIEAVLMVCVGMTFFDVCMSVVVSKDTTGLRSLDSSVITVVDSLNLGSSSIIPYFEKLLDVDEQPVLTADATLNSEFIGPQQAIREAVLEDESLVAKVLHPSRVNLDVVID